MYRLRSTAIQLVLLLAWIERLSAASATYWRLTLTQLNPSGLEYYFYEIDFFNPSSSGISGTYSSNRGGLISALLNDGLEIVTFQWPPLGGGYPALNDYIQFVCSPACDIRSVYISNANSATNRPNRMRLDYSQDSGSTWTSDWADFDTTAKTVNYNFPTSAPTSQPSRQPSRQPSAQPSTQPSSQPSTQPSSQPSSQPSAQPTDQPSVQPSCQPSSQPSAQPSTQPTAQPSNHPSTQPSSQPSAQPSAQPSSQPSNNMQTILASPTCRVRNGFAFAVTTSTGRAVSWGEAAYGGDSVTVSAWLQTGVVQIVPSRFAFLAVKSSGGAVHWGVNASYVGLAELQGAPNPLTGVVATEGAFAGIDTVTGGVVVVGSKHQGGDLSVAQAALLAANVKSLAASAGAFAAIKTDGSVACWGNVHAGADVAAGFLSSVTGAVQVVATRAAFAVLLSNDRVVTWGDRILGGDSSSVAAQLQDVHHLTASQACFVAFKRTSGIAVWGYHKYGGDTSAVASALSHGVVQVAFTSAAMAALKEEGTVVTWGHAGSGGNSTAVQAQLQNVVRLHGNGNSFAALTAAGGIVAWGKDVHGGQIPADKLSALSNGVVSIYHTERAFAAQKSDGSVVVWGQAGHGGGPGAAVEGLLTSGVHTICANDVAFSAIKTDGTVVAWGHTVSVASAGVQFTSTDLIQPVTCAE